MERLLYITFTDVIERCDFTNFFQDIVILQIFTVIFLQL